jgi:P27 family predicted phage terminase small subunit
MAGRPAKPMALHVVHGTVRKERHGKRVNELRMKPGNLGACPNWLPPEGIEEWKRLTTDREYSKCLSPAHRGALIDYCNLYGRMERSERQLPKWVDGKIAPADAETGIAPVEFLTSSERNNLHSLRMQLGLTPASQSKVQMPKDAQPKNAFAGF